VEACEREGRVAFGTNAFEFFMKLEREDRPELAVVIQPTLRYGDPDNYGKLTFQGTYIGFVMADNRGLHPNPAVRPGIVFDSRDPDTAAIGFWEVKNLHVLPARIAAETMTAAGKKTHLPRDFVPHGPLLIKAKFLD
jgi:hypothetical protein